MQSDAEFAAAVLEGRVATRGPWRASQPQQRRTESTQGSQGRGRGRSGARQHPGARPDAGAGGSKRARHGKQQQQQHQRQHGHGQDYSSRSSIAGSSGSADPLSVYGQPGPRSTARVAHCTACDVFVPRRPGDWEVHTAGIRHRRQLLSLRTFGEPNRLVLSAFESPPDSAEAAQRLVGAKAAQAFGLAPAGGAAGRGQQAGAATAAAPCPQLLQAARQLRTEALKQLLNMFGVGQIYNSAAAAFEEHHLAACLQQAASVLDQQQRQQHGAAASSAGSSSSSAGSSRWTVSTGAELAALAHLALTGQLDAAELAVTLAPQPAEAPRSQHAALAAALPLLLPPLRRSARLACLRLALPAPAGPDGVRLAQLWQQAWQSTLPALRELLESSAPLRTLRLELPSCLHESTAAYLPQLHAAAEAAPLAVRRHVLPALHPRAGRCSLLQLLPLGVLRDVLDLAAPLQPCTVHMTEAAAATAAAQPAG
ncbi:hypothetical protein ABPG75_000502 [Micractinium tetrahymenae]